MHSYKIGDTIPNYIGKNDQVFFDMDDSGASLVVCYSNPSLDEVSQFESSRPFEIRFTTLYNIIMITAKIGSLNWIDAPYTPHLSKNLTTLQFPGEGQGLGLILYLIDSSTGAIKHMRLLGLSERFSQGLIGEILDAKMQEFDRPTYNTALQGIYFAYSTKRIVQMSKDYCKF